MTDNYFKNTDSSPARQEDAAPVGNALSLQTRCPYPDCDKKFIVAEQQKKLTTTCQFCSRLITVREEQLHNFLDQTELNIPGALSENNCLIQPEKHRMVAVLEDIRSLWNVGSIFRSADGADFSFLFLCGITGYPPRKEIAKVSLGAEESVNWQYSRSALKAILHLKALGYQVIGMECTDKSLTLRNLCLSGQVRPPLALVLGNEVRGLYAETALSCDILCQLPMRGIKESLNVAVAFGIAAYTISDHLSVNDN